jgi:hypothetical protein
MKKLLFLVAFFFLTAANTAVVPYAMRDDDDIEIPIEQDKDLSEEDDDEVTLDHLWISLGKTSDSDLHIIYQQILFNDLDIEVIIPPPKA